jgi:hypothetical protein
MCSCKRRRNFSSVLLVPAPGQSAICFYVTSHEPRVTKYIHFDVLCPLLNFILSFVYVWDNSFSPFEITHHQSPSFSLSFYMLSYISFAFYYKIKLHALKSPTQYTSHETFPPFLVVTSGLWRVVELNEVNWLAILNWRTIWRCMRHITKIESRYLLYFLNSFEKEEVW